MVEHRSIMIVQLVRLIQLDQFRDHDSNDSIILFLLKKNIVFNLGKKQFEIRTKQQS